MLKYLAVSKPVSMMRPVYIPIDKIVFFFFFRLILCRSTEQRWSVFLDIFFSNFVSSVRKWDFHVKTKVYTDSTSSVSGSNKSLPASASGFVPSRIYVHNFPMYCIWLELYSFAHSYSWTTDWWVRIEREVEKEFCKSLMELRAPRNSLITKNTVRKITWAFNHYSREAKKNTSISSSLLSNKCWRKSYLTEYSHVLYENNLYYLEDNYDNLMQIFNHGSFSVKNFLSWLPLCWASWWCTHDVIITVWEKFMYMFTSTFLSL